MSQKITILAMFVACFLTIIIYITATPTVNACLQYKHKVMGGFLISCITSFVFLQKIVDNVNVNHTTSFIFVTLLFFIGSLITATYIFSTSYNLNYYINEYFENDSNLNKLLSKFNNSSKKSRQISDCREYHNGNYYKTKNLKCSDKSSCGNITSCGKDGAKISDFYIMSSNQSCLVPYFSGNYVSTRMLEIMLIGGVRFLDFDIYTKVKDAKAVPIVQSEFLNKPSLNYVTLENCFKKIKEVGFKKKYNDPIFIHLNLKTNNLESLDKIAISFMNIFSGENILGPRYSYKSSESIITQPICNFYKKVIIVVSGKCENTLLEQITNIHTNHNARIINEQNADYPSNPNEFAFDNQNMLTIVKPQESVNYNPSRPWSHGCQCVLMNLWKDTPQTKTHNKFFENSSFVIKSLSLQEDRIPDKIIKSKKI